MADVNEVRRDWEHIGANDPLWGVLSHRDKKGGVWDVEDFFRTGEQFIDELWPEITGHLPGLRTQDALDFGCGVGRLTQPLAKRFSTVVGLDVSSAMLEHAEALNHLDNIRFAHNAAADLRVLADASYDFVLSFIVLQHLPRSLIYAYVAEFYRVLRPGGGLFFSLPSAPAHTARGLVYRLVPQRALLTVMRFQRGAGMRMTHIPAPRMRSFLSETGFDVRAVVESPSAGNDWTVMNYFAAKPLATGNG